MPCEGVYEISFHVKKKKSNVFCPVAAEMNQCFVLQSTKTTIEKREREKLRACVCLYFSVSKRECVCILGMYSQK